MALRAQFAPVPFDENATIHTAKATARNQATGLGNLQKSAPLKQTTKRVFGEDLTNKVNAEKAGGANGKAKQGGLLTKKSAAKRTLKPKPSIYDIEYAPPSCPPADDFTDPELEAYIQELMRPIPVTVPRMNKRMTRVQSAWPDFAMPESDDETPAIVQREIHTEEQLTDAFETLDLEQFELNINFDDLI